MSVPELENAPPAFEARRLAGLGVAPDQVEQELARERPWLDSDQRAALWLVAWCVTDRGLSFAPARSAPAHPATIRLRVQLTLGGQA